MTEPVNLPEPVAQRWRVMRGDKWMEWEIVRSTSEPLGGHARYESEFLYSESQVRAIVAEAVADPRVAELEAELARLTRELEDAHRANRENWT